LAKVDRKDTSRNKALKILTTVVEEKGQDWGDDLKRMWQVGATMVFLTEECEGKLLEVLFKMIAATVVVIQSFFRMVRARRRYVNLKRVALFASSVFRMLPYRRKFDKLRKAAQKIQAFYLGKKARKLYVQTIASINLLQKEMKTHVFKQRLIRYREERRRQAASNIQALWKGVAQRKRFKKFKEDLKQYIPLLQEAILMANARRHLFIMKQEAAELALKKLKRQLEKKIERLEQLRNERQNLEGQKYRMHEDIKAAGSVRERYSLSKHLTEEMDTYLREEYHFLLAEEIYLQSEKMFLDEEDNFLARYVQDATLDQMKMYIYRKKMFAQRMKAFESSRKKMLLLRNEYGLKHKGSEKLTASESTPNLPEKSKEKGSEKLKVSESIPNLSEKSKDKEKKKDKDKDKEKEKKKDKDKDKDKARSFTKSLSTNSMRSMSSMKSTNSLEFDEDQSNSPSVDNLTFGDDDDN